jgi:hypothetical protein
MEDGASDDFLWTIVCINLIMLVFVIAYVAMVW